MIYSRLCVIYSRFRRAAGQTHCLETGRYCLLTGQRQRRVSLSVASGSGAHFWRAAKALNRNVELTSCDTSHGTTHSDVVYKVRDRPGATQRISHALSITARDLLVICERLVHGALLSALRHSSVLHQYLVSSVLTVFVRPSVYHSPSCHIFTRRRLRRCRAGSTRGMRCPAS